MPALAAGPVEGLHLNGHHSIPSKSIAPSELLVTQMIENSILGCPTLKGASARRLQGSLN